MEATRSRLLKRHTIKQSTVPNMPPWWYIADHTGKWVDGPYIGQQEAKERARFLDEGEQR